MAIANTPEEVAELREKIKVMANQGMQAIAIAAELGIPPGSIWWYMPPDDSISDEAVMRMRAMRDEGMSNVEIAKVIGVTRQWVAKVLGPIGAPQKRDAKPVMVRSSKETVKALEERADALGYRYPRGFRANQPSIPAMLDAVASGDLIIIPSGKKKRKG